ncbi:SLATT domain-containing protein [Bacillus atrophaeus]|uniref:SLATT domain-containing protein n=1 Tax=Bacillus atrophaeus TaxID=1452 RepID=UPI00227FC089|nr:SLATT domain-containing protein [Bacillus atrophaeus]MCY8837706.1 SLATT domain-containing protein [Bacillus atrophaeus]
MSSNDELNLKLKELLEIIKIEMLSSSNAGNELRDKARKTKVSSIAISALITIVLGLTFLKEYGKWAAIILSGILTAINSWDAYTSYDKRSQQELNITSLLKNLYQDIHLYLTGNNSPEDSVYKDFKKRYDEIQEQYTDDRKSLENESSNNSDGKENQ